MSIEQMPVEIVTYILDSLPFREKKKARLVCHYWRAILDSGRYYFLPYKFQRRNYCFRSSILNNYSMKFLLNSSRKIDTIHLRGVTKQMPSMTHSRNRFPKIQNGVIGKQNSSPTLLSFMKYGCDHTESLEILKFAFEKADMYQIRKLFPHVKWTNLCELDLTVVMTAFKMKRSRKQVTSMICFLTFVKVPKLKKLLINLNHSSNLCDDGKLNRDFVSKLYEFISRHVLTLKICVWIIRTRTIRGGFPMPQISEAILEPIRNNLKLERCDTLINGGSIILLALPILTGSNTLTSFTCCILNGDQLTPEILAQLEEIFRENRTSLKNIHIRLHTIDMSWIKNFTKLESLSIEIGVLEDGLSNMNISGLSFPQLTSFEMKAFVSNIPYNFDTWIVDRMKNLEKVTLSTFRSFMSISVIRTLLDGLPKIKEIVVGWDFLAFTTAPAVKEYCNVTDGLTFIPKGVSSDGFFINYSIEVDRLALTN